MNKTIKKTLALALICLATASASATTVQVRETGPLVQGMASNGLLLPIKTTSDNYWTGLQTILVNGSRQLLAFCVDPWEWSPSSNQGYVESNNLEAYFGNTRAGLIRELYGDAYSSTLVATDAGKENAAAFQLALWEIIGDNQLNLAEGLVRKVAGTNANIVTAAQLLLTNLGDGSSSGDNYSFDIFSNGKAMGVGTSGFQDYLVVNRIPEPTTAALLMAALGIFGFSQLRRSKQRAAG